MVEVGPPSRMSVHETEPIEGRSRTSSSSAMLVGTMAPSVHVRPWAAQASWQSCWTSLKVHEYTGGGGGGATGGGGEGGGGEIGRAHV